MTRRRRRLLWSGAIVVVLALIAAAVLVVVATTGRQQADDPRSSTRSGIGALGQLLADAGVTVTTVTSVDQAVHQTTGDDATTLVVANPQELSADEATRLEQAAPNRVVLLRPSTLALDHFAVQADAVAPVDGVLAPGCDDPGTQRAGAVIFSDMRASYRPTGPNDLSCYPVGDGFGYLRAGTTTGQQIDLLAGGIANDELAQQGNAALGMNILGTRSTVVWLMAEKSAIAADRPAQPTLLPRWWELALVQAFVGLIAVGIWRGRRLGPILTEPLPVRVRAAETVEGHGRLYFRLTARDRAAAALRRLAVARLSSAFGHGSDPMALSEALAGRTGRDVRGVHQLLFGPPPADDHELLDLTRGLDRIEQEARQP